MNNGYSKPIDIFVKSEESNFPPNNTFPGAPPNNMSPNTYYIETLSFLYNEYHIPEDSSEIITLDENEEDKTDPKTNH
jgi:hypothetical protein